MNTWNAEKLLVPGVCLAPPAEELGSLRAISGRPQRTRKESSVTTLKRRTLVLVFFLVLAGLGAFWATSSQAARPAIATLPETGGTTIACTIITDPTKEISLAGFGTFQPVHTGAPPTLVALTGDPYISERGLKTVPIQILANDGDAFAEGVGQTRFWLDATRPLKSAIWEKKAGTEFPAIQEMRFHFFYTVEAMPGKVFRSM